MAGADRTLVASVLFLDMVGYSMAGVGEQLGLKHAFNSVVLSALEHVEPEGRVVVDTGDGAAIAVLGNPEGALYVATAIFDRAHDIRVRGGVNLGPVSLLQDINGGRNVVGDGINGAQRIMDFAKGGELLVSRSFYEVVTLMSPDYASMFSHEGSRTDKHGRAHEIHAMRPGVRVGRRIADPAPARAPRGRDAAGAAPVVSDAGAHLMVSAYTEDSVRALLERFAAEGRRILAQPTRIGSKWFASVEKPGAAEATVRALGLKRLVSGATREAVDAKVAELLEFGAKLVQEPECVDGVWTAVCETR